MTYSKPEVKTLGEATAVIEIVGHKVPSKVGDGIRGPIFDPAYDLDE